MKFGRGTVFVLGAGFTKAFLPKAPLLVGDFGGERLLETFAHFEWPRALLEAEMTRNERPGEINLERLMTRLKDGMPYDHSTGAENQLAEMLTQLMREFRNRLNAARKSPADHAGELELFGRHCLQNEITCITFNYDDLLDEQLSQPDSLDGMHRWSPDSGYGFPCHASPDFARSRDLHFSILPRSLLLKLHGSVNWRVPLGTPRPYALEWIRHHESWPFQGSGWSVSPQDVEELLEPEPLLIPPVLTKTELREQPILRRVWSKAVEVLEEASRVVFIGYSLPVTDLAAGYLFREGLFHLDANRCISVVDFADCDESKDKKLSRLLSSYRNVFPSIEPAQVSFSGAAEWIRNNLTGWLFDSRGDVVAFNAAGCVISRSGRFIGTIRGYTGGRDVWHGLYQGEIVADNRFLRQESPPADNRGGSEPAVLPGVPNVPDPIDAIPIPGGYRDVEFAD